MCRLSASGACVFCRIVDGMAPVTTVHEDHRLVIIEPIGPHAPGHLLVIPKVHMASAVDQPHLAGVIATEALRWATEAGIESFNLLTSIGAAATQTVRHLHYHILPRGQNDGLPKDWPWLRDM